jgi:two-component system alkaline phosphatase synthesis response regulator PhoP
METILIIEDDAALSRGLKDNFSYQGYAVLLAADGEKGFEMAVNARPALIVLDLMLPKMNGYEICRRLRREGLDMPILVLTAKAEESDVVLGLELGADDYVKKPFSVRELLARAEALLRRRRGGEPERWAFGEHTLDVRARTLTREGQPVEISPKEFALLHFFLQRAGQALSREEILNHVWGYDVSVTPRSIDRFVATLRRKIERDPHHPAHILTAREFGYKFDADGQAAGLKSEA